MCICRNYTEFLSSVAPEDIAQFYAHGWLNTGNCTEGGRAEMAYFYPSELRNTEKMRLPTRADLQHFTIKRPLHLHASEHCTLQNSLVEPLGDLCQLGSDLLFPLYAQRFLLTDYRSMTVYRVIDDRKCSLHVYSPMGNAFMAEYEMLLHSILDEDKNVEFNRHSTHDSSAWIDWHNHAILSYDRMWLGRVDSHLLKNSFHQLNAERRSVSM